jgi:hypothetical protein
MPTIPIVTNKPCPYEPEGKGLSLSEQVRGGETARIVDDQPRRGEGVLCS